MPAPRDDVAEAPRGAALVPIHDTRLPPETLPDPRRSDVDEWGRSE
jgi:hypothetical protein